MVDAWNIGSYGHNYWMHYVPLLDTITKDDVLSFIKDILYSTDIAKYICSANKVAAHWIHTETMTIFDMKQYR